MNELRLCMIDDICNDLEQLKSHLLENIPDIVREDSIKSFPFPLSDEITGKKYGRGEQINRIYDTLVSNWNNFDVFLLDWSLLGNNDENSDAVSVNVLHKIFAEHQAICDDIKNEEKFVIIITGKRSRNVDFSFEEVNNKVVCVDKPSYEERIFCKACCKCSVGTFKSGHCGQHDKDKKECSANDCLFEVLKMISGIKEGKENERS